MLKVYTPIKRNNYIRINRRLDKIILNIYINKS